MYIYIYIHTYRVKAGKTLTSGEQLVERMVVLLPAARLFTISLSLSLRIYLYVSYKSVYRVNP